MIIDASHYLALAAAYVRGVVGEPNLGDPAAAGARRVSIDHVLNHVVAVATR